MTCIHCHDGKLVRSIETANFKIDDNTTVTVKDIPADKCDKCGRIFYDKNANLFIDEEIAKLA